MKEKKIITIITPNETKVIEGDSFFVLACKREEDGLHVNGSVCLSGDLTTKASFYYALLSELSKLEDKYPEFIGVRKGYEDGKLPRYADAPNKDGGEDNA